jgi:hypothetical protein
VLTTITDFLALLRTVADALEQQPGSSLDDAVTREELQHLRCLITLRLNETAYHFDDQVTTG